MIIDVFSDLSVKKYTYVFSKIPSSLFPHKNVGCRSPTSSGKLGLFFGINNIDRKRTKSRKQRYNVDFIAIFSTNLRLYHRIRDTFVRISSLVLKAVKIRLFSVEIRL